MTLEEAANQICEAVTQLRNLVLSAQEHGHDVNVMDSSGGNVHITSEQWEVQVRSSVTEHA